MVFSIGQRVFVGETGEYGTVTKTRFLGKYGLKIQKDSGSIMAYETKHATADIYDKETGTNGNGETIEPPMDVKTDGIELLTSLNIPEDKQTLYFFKFAVGLSAQEQHTYINEFNSVKDDDTAKQTFIDRLMSDLEDDSSFVQSEGGKALFNIEDGIRASMSQKLFSEFSKEQREALILEWMSIKNFKHQKAEFLHKMYTDLMTSDEFIRVEGIKALSELGLNVEQQSVLFTKFLTESDEQTKKTFIEDWEKVRSSRSRRREFLKNIIAALQADA